MEADFERYTQAQQRKFIRKVDNVFPYTLLKDAMIQDHQKTGTVTFFINKSIRLKGKITNLVEEGIVELPLTIKGVKTVRKRDEDITLRKLFFFGEAFDKTFAQDDILTGRFFPAPHGVPTRG